MTDIEISNACFFEILRIVVDRKARSEWKAPRTLGIILILPVGQYEIPFPWESFPLAM